MAANPNPPTSAWQHASLLVAGLAAILLGAADAWVGHKLGAPFDYSAIGAGFAALGIKGISGQPS